MGEFLVWPETPKRKGKRQIERRPFAITSEKYKNMQKRKREEKEDAERKNEERKKKIKNAKQAKNKIKFVRKNFSTMIKTQIYFARSARKH